ncbi:MAG: hypothetical protein KDD36_01470 [Flavobacteriales bacterium]|nr:hypothetical protein [Flavobacteriales bacterium]
MTGLQFRVFIFVLMLFSGVATAQTPDRFAVMQMQLEALGETTAPNLNETVRTSVSGAPIQEFVRAMAISNSLNINVDPNLNITVVNNFAGESVKNILLFLCKQYDLDLKFIGSIISISKYEAPKPEPKAYVPKVITVSYDSAGDALTVDLKNDTLELVAREITKRSGKNVIIQKEVSRQIISGFLQNVPFESALDKIAYANGLVLNKTDDGFFVIGKESAGNDAGSNNGGRNNKKGDRSGGNRSANAGLKVEVIAGTDPVLMNVDATAVPIADVVAEASQQLGVNFNLLSEPKGDANMSLTRVTYDQLLTFLFNGTDHGFTKEGQVYQIGERKTESIRLAIVHPLQYRRAETIEKVIPKDLRAGVEIVVEKEQNSLVMSGSERAIREIQEFLKGVDKVVPLVLIEIIIVDVNSNTTVSTGIKAGLSDDPPNNRELLPGVKYTMNAERINELLSLMGTSGLINLGSVSPNFYIDIEAMEQQGFIKKRSTPKLATINGNEANMSIGATAFYPEVTNSVVGTQTPQNITQTVWKSLEASLKIKITPVVSGDDHVTLDITVEQSDFTARVSDTAPPGKVTRSFQSLVRVKNGDMVVLGGLEEKANNDTGTGTPFLSRVPVLKWFFSSRTKQDSKSKLSLFIKPTVIY